MDYGDAIFSRTKLIAEAWDAGGMELPILPKGKHWYLFEDTNACLQTNKTKKLSIIKAEARRIVIAVGK